MSKKKRVGEFLDLLETLSEEELFSLGRILGVKFGGLEVLNSDGVPIGKTVGELRDEFSPEELKEKDYKIRAVKRDAEDIVEDIVTIFYKSSWGQQNDVLEIMRASLEKKSCTEEPTESDCALTINSPIRPGEVPTDGTSTKD